MNDDGDADAKCLLQTEIGVLKSLLRNVDRD